MPVSATFTVPGLARARATTSATEAIFSLGEASSSMGTRPSMAMCVKSRRASYFTLELTSWLMACVPGPQITSV